MQSRGVLTRRALLGLAALSVVGCSKHRTHTAQKPPVVLDAAALAIARRTEQSLLATYDARMQSAGVHKRARLQVARAIHATHLAALHGTAASPIPAPTVAPDLRAALRASAAQLRGLAVAAADGANAALLASIAASHEISGR